MNTRTRYNARFVLGSNEVYNFQLANKLLHLQNTAIEQKRYSDMQKRFRHAFPSSLASCLLCLELCPSGDLSIYQYIGADSSYIFSSSDNAVSTISTMVTSELSSADSTMSAISLADVLSSVSINGRSFSIGAERLLIPNADIPPASGPSTGSLDIALTFVQSPLFTRICTLNTHLPEFFVFDLLPPVNPLTSLLSPVAGWSVHNAHIYAFDVVAATFFKYLTSRINYSEPLRAKIAQVVGDCKSPEKLTTGKLRDLLQEYSENGNRLLTFMCDKPATVHISIAKTADGQPSKHCLPFFVQRTKEGVSDFNTPLSTFERICRYNEGEEHQSIAAYLKRANAAKISAQDRLNFCECTRRLAENETEDILKEITRDRVNLLGSDWLFHTAEEHGVISEHITPDTIQNALNKTFINNANEMSSLALINRPKKDV